MKTLFKLMLTVIIIIAIAVPAFSNDTCCPSGKKACAHEHGKDGKCCTVTDLKLTDKQKTEFDKFHKECSEATAKIHEKIAKLKAEKCKLMTAEKPDKKAIDTAIDEIGKLTVESQKIAADCKLNIRAMLTPEQLKKLNEARGKKDCCCCCCCDHGCFQCCTHTASCEKKCLKEVKEGKKVMMMKTSTGCPSECLGHDETNCPAKKKETK
jgi:Spy/CpxP family protein refolding chaperone